MKKIKLHKGRGEGFYYAFTSSEEQELKKLLRSVTGLDPKAEDTLIAEFLKQAEILCDWRIVMEQAPSREDHRANFNDTLKSLKSARKHLNRILNTDIPVFYARKIKNPTIGQVMHDNLTDFVNTGILTKESKAAMAHIDRLIPIFERYADQKGQGRINPNKEFTITLAHMFYNVFKVAPTTYEEGYFSKVCYKLFSAVGLNYTNMKRQIHAAVKSAKTVPPYHQL
jgi:hypothetical protein